MAVEAALEPFRLGTASRGSLPRRVPTAAGRVLDAVVALEHRAHGARLARRRVEDVLAVQKAGQDCAHLAVVV